VLEPYHVEQRFQWSLRQYLRVSSIAPFAFERRMNMEGTGRKV
jgi:hypothetical protein